MRKYRAMSYEEIAEALHLHPSSIRNIERRALRKLRKNPLTKNLKGMTRESRSNLIGTLLEDERGL